MKQLKRRTLFVLLFTLLLAAGTLLFCLLYVLQGSAWAASSVNQSTHRGGKLSSGSLFDRNGVLLYDGENQSYADSALLRRATLHVVGDDAGNILTGGQRLFSRKLVGYNPVTGATLGGNDVYLSIDSALNETAYQALDGRKGAVALYNYKTGEVLCMVSTPAYDPADADETAAVAGGDPAYDGAYLNRVVSSTFTPGSTFKVVTTAAALEALPDVGSYSFECTGSFSIGGDRVTCPSAHGTVDLATALTRSCNCAFADLSLRLGGSTLENYARKAGLLDSLSISGVSSAQGHFDAAADGTLDLGWSGVGQYHDLVCPVNMLTLMGCIANGGSAATPRLLQRVATASGLPAGGAGKSTSSIDWDSATCETLVEMMRNNVLNNYGQERFGDLPVCAKSGTAEVGEGLSPHAWFVGFVDSEEYPYAFVSVVENGGGGTSVSGGIIAAVLAAATGGN